MAGEFQFLHGNQRYGRVALESVLPYARGVNSNSPCTGLQTSELISSCGTARFPNIKPRRAPPMMETSDTMRWRLQSWRGKPVAEFTFIREEAFAKIRTKSSKPLRENTPHNARTATEITRPRDPPFMEATVPAAAAEPRRGMAHWRAGPHADPLPPKNAAPNEPSIRIMIPTARPIENTLPGERLPGSMGNL